VFSKGALGDLKFISNTEPKPRLRQFEEIGLGFKFQGFVNTISITTRGKTLVPNTCKH